MNKWVVYMLLEFFRFFRKLINLIFYLILNSYNLYSLHFILRVVLIHTWNHFTGLDDLLIDNNFTFKNWKKNFIFSIVTNAYYCVDTFFFLR
jgi:hypothetical protein